MDSHHHYSIDVLPQELVHEIIDIAAFSDVEKHVADLKALRLVCRSFEYRCRSHLFRHITLDPFRIDIDEECGAVPYIHPCIRPSSESSFAPLIHSCTIRIVEHLFSPRVRHVARYTLLRIPNLETLIIDLTVAPYDEGKWKRYVTLMEATVPPLPSVVNLVIKGYQFRPAISPIAVVASLPNVQCLSFADSKYREPREPEPLSPHPPALVGPVHLRCVFEPRFFQDEHPFERLELTMKTPLVYYSRTLVQLSIVCGTDLGFGIDLDAVPEILTIPSVSIESSHVVLESFVALLHSVSINKRVRTRDICLTVPMPQSILKRCDLWSWMRGFNWRNASLHEMRDIPWLRDILRRPHLRNGKKFTIAVTITGCGEWTSERCLQCAAAAFGYWNPDSVNEFSVRFKGQSVSRVTSDGVEFSDA
ncbi:hypothetical protein BDZ89DRAFT_1072778 [Hymenopellis radicata]|nr:hypothetical protein BDZ89DRAFT_1072778 [Hymenopellis radicata]